ncbi:MAG: WG repeat-containing protein [Bacteroidales bacterium]|nr:WG repeat-containing protein [Bacteroidales bacterium]
MKRIVFLFLVSLFISNIYAQKRYSIEIDINYDSVYLLEDDYFAVKENGRWGVMQNNKKIVNCIYDGIDACGDGIITVIQNDKVGFVDKNGNVICEPKYLTETDYTRADKSPLNIFSHGSALVYDGNRLLLINNKGENIFDQNTEIVSKVDNTVIYKTNGAYGLADATGQSLTEAKYIQIQAIIEGKLYAYIGIRDGMKLWGLLNANGEVKSHAYFDVVQLVNKTDRLYIKGFLPTGKQALFDENGDILFQPIYQVVEPTVYPSLFSVTQDGKKGVLSSDYTLYVPTAYEQVQIVTMNQKDTFFVGINDGVSFVLNNKNQLIAHYEGNITGFISYSDEEVIFAVDSFLTYGVMSSKDGWLIRPEFVEALGTVNDNVILRKGKKWGAMNLRGEEVIPFEFNKVRVSDNRTYVVFFDGKNNSVLLNDKAEKKTFPKVKKVAAYPDYIEYFYKNEYSRLYSQGKEIKTQSLSIGNESQGLLTIKDKKGWTYVDAKTKEALTDKHFDQVSNFEGNLALVVIDDCIAVIDKNFNVTDTVITAKKTDLSLAFAKLYLATKRNQKFVVLNINGKYGVIKINTNKS